jgi:hypothetical protein
MNFGDVIRGVEVSVGTRGPWLSAILATHLAYTIFSTHLDLLSSNHARLLINQHLALIKSASAFLYALDVLKTSRLCCAQSTSQTTHHKPTI